MEILKKLYWSSYSAMNIYSALHNVKKLSKSDERFRSRVIDNNWYSGDHVIEAIGEDPDSVLLEHGLHLGNYYHKYLERSVINRVITFSDFRSKLLESINKEAVPIGP
jgi:capsule polysaccharide modification protein KpsS